MHPRVTPLLSGTKVIPVLVIENADFAQPLAQCLLDNGLPVVEISLRSDESYRAIEEIASKVNGAVIGVGSILNEMQLNSAQSAGGWFGGSPGVSERLLRALELNDWPFLPGATTLSEIHEPQGSRLHGAETVSSQHCWRSPYAQGYHRTG